MSATQTLHFNNEKHFDEVAALYAPFKNYVKGVVPLMLEHIWALRNKKETDCSNGLMHTGWLGRLVTLDKRVMDTAAQDDIKGWPLLRESLETIINDCLHQQDLPLMIETCCHMLFPLLRQRFSINYTFPSRQFHCWWYTVHDENTHVAVHLVNAYQPQSPFQNYGHFVTTLIAAIEDAVKRFSGIRKVSCGSWLNQVPRFQRLWPDTFSSNQKVLNSDGGFGPGAWGQYMTREGGFNKTVGDSLRRTMKHPFPLTEVEGPVEELLNHLKKHISAFE